MQRSHVRSFRPHQGIILFNNNLTVSIENELQGVSVPIRGLFYLTFSCFANGNNVPCFRPHQGIILFNEDTQLV